MTTDECFFFFFVVVIFFSPHADAESMEEEAEFNWEEYLEETGAEATPHTTFKHVSLHL